MLDQSEVRASFSMAILYLELRLDREVSESPGNKNHDTNYDEEYRTFLNKVLFTSGILSTNAENYHYEVRLIWLQYALHVYDGDLGRAVDCLQSIIVQNNCEITLPNQTNSNMIEVNIVNQLITIMNRKTELYKVDELYKMQRYEDVCDILIECLNNGTELKDTPFGMQMELLLDCLWRTDRFSEAMIWLERMLEYNRDQLIKTRLQYKNKRAKWEERVRFSLVYIQALLNDENVAELGMYIV